MYEIEGYHHYEEQRDAYINVIKITIIADSEAEALEKAKKHHPSKPLFRCVGSVEIVKRKDFA
ncbi:MAG: hypothetical protein ACEQR7_09035 [Agathobacter rectalis]